MEAEDLDRLLELDDHPGPARRISSAKRSEIVEGALDAWEANAGVAASAPPTPLVVSVPWYRIAAVAAMVAAIVVSGGAALAWWLTQPAPAQPDPMPAPAVSGREVAPPATGHEVAGGPTNSVTVSEEPGGEAEPAPEASPRAPATASAEDLVEQGNRLRSERRWRAAERAYLGASQQRPGSETAHVADVAAADIRLEHRGRASGAARLYRRALRGQPNGPLAPEAREGLVRAYRAMGQPEQERRALEELIRSQPSTSAAERARERVRELGPPR